MGTGTGVMLWSSAPYTPACFPILLLCANVVEQCRSVVPVWLFLCHCCHLLVPPAPNLPSRWPRESLSLSCSCEASRMEEKKHTNILERPYHAGGIFRDICVCVFLQILHYGAACPSVLVQIVGGWGRKAFSVSSPQHTSQGAAW